MNGTSGLRSVPPNGSDKAVVDAGTESASSATDLDLCVRRVAMGDKAAFESVYRQMAGPVYGLARRVLRDPAQAEEVAQEVLVEIWRTAGRFDQAKGSARAWMLTIAHRRAIDRVRAEQASHERDTKAATTSAQVPFDEVAESVEARLEAQRVRHCMGGLTDLQRESITLAYYGGYTYPEVAALLSTPLGTVKSRLRDGMTRLRDCLGVGR